MLLRNRGWWFVVVPAVLALAGCLGSSGGEAYAIEGASSADLLATLPASTAPAGPVAGIGSGSRAVRLPAELPRSFQCVGDATPADPADDEVTRVLIWRGDEEASLSGSRGRTFRAYEQVPGAEPWNVTSRARRLAGGGVVFEADGVELQLRPAGLVWSGSLREGGGPANALTCWCQEELFGNPWGGTAGTLPAHYDPEAGCVDATGRPARNQLPVEVVRETGFGECADLRGAALDAHVVGATIEGWSLAGALLDGATLRFAELRWADLRGADLGGLWFTHGSLEGVMDDATVPPADRSCTTRLDGGYPRLLCSHRPLLGL